MKYTMLIILMLLGIVLTCTLLRQIIFYPSEDEFGDQLLTAIVLVLVAVFLGMQWL